MEKMTPPDPDFSKAQEKLPTRAEKIGIIGVGRVGRSMALALTRIGIPVAAVCDRRIRVAEAMAKACGPQTCAIPLNQLPRALSVILICVPDDAISLVAEELVAHADIAADTVAAHCSGALTSAALAPLRSKTQLLASMHPVQTFPGAKDDWQRLSGIYFALEGEPTAVMRLQTIVTALNSKAITLLPEHKALYHIGCVFASNYLIALQDAAAQCLKASGLKEREALTLFKPLQQTTWRNIEQEGLIGALTGPIARGDVGTITEHLKALASHVPQAQEVYIQLGLQLLLLLKRATGKLSVDQRQIETLLLSERKEKNRT
ncbi:DUF2520 domain-containing protein [candidate division KSB1 bacterium]|nr:DUF2520 domain-containing protein [candidate division KSB1 bacterium]